MPAADWGQVVDSFQRGAEFTQRYRANKQRERANELILKEMGREGFDKDQSGMATAADIKDTFGVDTPLYQHEELPDPLAFMLGRKIKGWFSKAKKGKKKQALELGGEEGGFESSNPGIAPEEDVAAAPMGEEMDEFADGGTIADAMEDARGTSQAFATQAGVTPQTTVQAGGARPVPSVTGVIETGFADGGEVSEEEKIRQRAAQNRANNPGRVSSSTENVRGADRTSKPTPAQQKTLDRLRDKVNMRNPANGSRAGNAVRGAGRTVGRVAIPAVMAGQAFRQMDPSTDERMGERFGWDMNSGDPEGSFGGFLKYLGMRGLLYASDLGDFLTGGTASKMLYRDEGREFGGEGTGGTQQALPVDQLPDAPEGTMGNPMELETTTIRGRRSALPDDDDGVPDNAMVNFGDIDVDAKDVPNLQTDDWRKYRIVAMQHAARKGMDPASAKEYADDQITRMQIKGFINYGQQGLALQQAGNTKGAMAAYRAAFQYFPNGNDVEFGTSTNKRTGRKQIIGFGRDEKTGKLVPGSELIMDPERIAVMLENFQNPQAFRAWTKDWRDFNEGQKRYTEVTKPLAQAQADSLANNSEARILAAENAALRARAGGAGGGYRQSDMRGDAALFRDSPQIQQLAIDDPAMAQQLVGVMGRIKAKYPQLTPDDIVTATMNAANDGTLPQWLQRMGIMGGAQQPQQAIPVDQGTAADPEMAGLSPEEIEWANRPAQ